MSNLFTSSIGRKLVMSITGAFLVIFMLFHASMNVVAIFSAEGYNMICEFLGANWYALAASMVLAAGFVLHIAYATYLTLMNLRARGAQRYAVKTAPQGVTWASRNMFVLGLVVLGGLGVHLVNFWAKMQLVELTMTHEAIDAAVAAGTMIHPADGYGQIAHLFANPVYCAVYIVWIAALWFHLTHGLWSMMQTVGWANKTWYPRLKCIANAFSTLICLAFVLVIVVFYLRSLGCCGVCM